MESPTGPELRTDPAVRTRVPALAVRGPLLADALVRQFPLPIWAELAAALIIGAGYGPARPS